MYKHKQLQILIHGGKTQLEEQQEFNYNIIHCSLLPGFWSLISPDDLTEKVRFSLDKIERPKPRKPIILVTLHKKEKHKR